MDSVVLRDGDIVYVQSPGTASPASWVGVSNIDWLQLAQQKSRLLGLIWDKPDDILWGLINLIDAIQDQAAEDGLPVVWIRDANELEEER